MLTQALCNQLNKSAFNIGQTIQHFFDLIKKGIYDNFDDWANEQLGENGRGSDKESIFVHVVVFIWPFVCSSSIAKNYDSKYGLDTFFRGNAADTFREIVTLLGFTEETYPYHAKYDKEEDKNKVLRIWEGPKHTMEDKGCDGE